MNFQMKLKRLVCYFAGHKYDRFNVLEVKKWVE